jgi:hypothetical protein
MSDSDKPVTLASSGGRAPPSAAAGRGRPCGRRSSGRPSALFRPWPAAPPEPIATPEALARFLDTRASFIAQTSLYGYLRTRAGMRYPELFDDDPFVEGINIAKWHVWLDCLSDLAVYAGGRWRSTRRARRRASAA